MLARLKHAFNDPKLALHIICRRYLKISLTQKVFAYKSEFRSDSENGNYAASVVKALKNQKSFDNFKRSRDYREILEHVSRDQGQKYLDIILARNDGLFDAAINTVFTMDDIGSPIKHHYKVFNQSFELSPTTLRYLKVASDINGLFGKRFDHVVEIGCGYGGQALVNDQVLEISYATLFDLPFVNQLITRYLNSIVLNGAFRVTTINESIPDGYDLAISNYAFSELPSVLQKTYIRKVLANSKCGYLTMNSGLGGKNSVGKLTVSELQQLLPSCEIYEEEPNTFEFNYIIVWGHNRDFARKHLSLKQIK